MEEKKQNKKPNSGRKNNQKMKPYLIYEYLMFESDENNVKTIKDIVNHLKTHGIHAERRSVYRDIVAINEAILLTERHEGGAEKISNIKQAEKLLQNKKARTIVYDASEKGYYVKHRRYDLKDIQILIECINAAKFVDEERAARLIKVICSLVSEQQALNIKNEVLLVDRVNSENTSIFDMITQINIAMSSAQGKNTHTPEKIKFKYLSYIVDDAVKQIERRKGEWLTVSPYKLIINAGNYYLMGYDHKLKKIITFRIDRMKDLQLTGEPRGGEEAYRALNMKDYLKEHFGMFHGEPDFVRLRASNLLLDTFVDRFGTKGIHYFKDDDRHFTVRISVAPNEQFFGWLCALGKKVKIVSPDYVVEDFKKYLDKLRNMYD